MGSLCITIHPSCSNYTNTFYFIFLKANMLKPSIKSCHSVAYNFHRLSILLGIKSKLSPSDLSVLLSYRCPLTHVFPATLGASLLYPEHTGWQSLQTVPCLRHSPSTALLDILLSHHQSHYFILFPSRNSLPFEMTVFIYFFIIFPIKQKLEDSQGLAYLVLCCHLFTVVKA